MAEELAPHAILPESWSVKEVVADLKKDLVTHLDKQDVTLGEISSKVDTKADKADLIAIGLKIEGHSTRITTLEQHRLDELASKKFRNRVWAVVGTASGVAAVIVGSLIDAHII